MEDYSIVKDDYFYIKEQAFKDIQQIPFARRIQPVKEHKENVPRENESENSKENSGNTNKIKNEENHSRHIFCPRDDSPLITVSLKNIYIDYCPTCYGLWLDFGELEKLLKRQLDKTKIFKEKLLYKVKEEIEEPLVCPLCHTGLHKHKHYNANITSDLCPICGGIWLDSGEFAALYLEKKHEESAQDILAEVIGKYIDITA